LSRSASPSSSSGRRTRNRTSASAANSLRPTYRPIAPTPTTPIFIVAHLTSGPSSKHNSRTPALDHDHLFAADVRAARAVAAQRAVVGLVPGPLEQQRRVAACVDSPQMTDRGEVQRAVEPRRAPHAVFDLVPFLLADLDH